jgi:hypothetical protein
MSNLVTRQSSSPYYSSSRAFIAVLVAALLGLATYIPEGQAASRSSRTYSLFSGRTKLTLPKTAGAPQKVNSKLFLVRPKDSSKRFAVYVSREPLASDERKMSSKQQGESIRRLLEGQGYTVTSFTSRGQEYRASFTTYTSLPWQAVGTAAAQGIAKFTRTADQQLIGVILFCEPSEWTDPAVEKFKQSVNKSVVMKR